MLVADERALDLWHLSSVVEHVVGVVTAHVHRRMQVVVVVMVEHWTLVVQAGWVSRHDHEAGLGSVHGQPPVAGHAISSISASVVPYRSVLLSWTEKLIYIQNYDFGSISFPTQNRALVAVCR